MNAHAGANATSISDSTLEAPLSHEELEAHLRQEDPEALEALWAKADDVRRRNVGDAVYLRGLVEISNHCARECHYCGIRSGNTTVHRYRMSRMEVLDCAKQARDLGYGTVVLQAGEDAALTCDWVAEVVRQIKVATGLAVTLSLGERADDELKVWKDAGADRYLMRFETSNPDLFALIHPPRSGSFVDRAELLRRLRRMGYEVGSGVLIGIPGQTYGDLARDIELFHELQLDMIGVGPFIPHPQTPLGKMLFPQNVDQVPNTEAMTYKVLALTRLMRPDANIPSTTALATLNLSTGRELGLQRGANILMPNLTPTQYRALYEIYPAKACIRETAVQCHGCIKMRLMSIGRHIGQGAGSSPSFGKRNETAVG
jgi:biotin synthase